MKDLLFITVLIAITTSCQKKEADCYDADLKKQYETINCIQDCPGVIGCDGKKYCNECIANSHGIRVK
ncbi:MAG: kazal domain protein [Sphingobacteriaceae bacterium]|nr:kazal domain protein [Sphingobacteriaceae bacterium]MBK7817989.1 kazal domain protein [Sphingobacteriaceae bacterium]